MTSPAQIDANRRNAQRSTGPRSAEGKRRVSRNAVTHGLDSRAVVLPGEDAPAYAQYRAAMIADHQPVGAEEQDCVERMVACQWRIQRVWRAEADVHRQAGARLRFEADAGTALLFDLQHEKAFAALDVREARLCRTYERSSRRLQELQALRRKGMRHIIEDDAQPAPEAEAATPPAATASPDSEYAQSAEPTQWPELPELPGETMPPDFATDSDVSAIPETVEQSRLAVEQVRDAA